MRHLPIDDDLDEFEELAVLFADSGIWVSNALKKLYSCMIDKIKYSQMVVRFENLRINFSLNHSIKQ